MIVVEVGITADTPGVSPGDMQERLAADPCSTSTTEHWQPFQDSGTGVVREANEAGIPLQFTTIWRDGSGAGSHGPSFMFRARIIAILVPLRYAHAPNGIIDYRDYIQTRALLIHLLKGLNTTEWKRITGGEGALWRQHVRTLRMVSQANMAETNPDQGAREAHPDSIFSLGQSVVLAVITYVDRVSISLAAPSISEELGLSPIQTGLVFSVFALAYALFGVPTAWLGDRFGARRVIAGIVSAWSVFTALTGVVNRYWMLSAIRFLFGAGEAGAYPNMTWGLEQLVPPSTAAVLLWEQCGWGVIGVRR